MVPPDPPPLSRIHPRFTRVPRTITGKGGEPPERWGLPLLLPTWQPWSACLGGRNVPPLRRTWSAPFWSVVPDPCKPSCGSSGSSVSLTTTNLLEGEGNHNP